MTDWQGFAHRWAASFLCEADVDILPQYELVATTVFVAFHRIMAVIYPSGIAIAKP